MFIIQVFLGYDSLLGQLDPNDRGILLHRNANTNLTNDKRYQLDATIVIYYHKYKYVSGIYMTIFRSTGCVYCIWCSALGVVAVVLRSRCVVLCTVHKTAHVETCRDICDNKSQLLHQVGTSRHFHI